MSAGVSRAARGATTDAEPGARGWWDTELFGAWVLVNGIAYAVIPISGAVLETVASSATQDLVAGHKWLAVVVIALVAGAFEGVFVGHWQWRLLRRRLPGLPHRPWIAATIVPVCLVWLLVIGPKAVDVMAQGGNTLGVFRNGFIQALVFGPLVGIAQVRVLRDQTTRWAWWFLANVTTFLTGAVLNGFGAWLADQLSVSTKFAFAFPVVAFAVHGTWMLWVSAPQAVIDGPPAGGGTDGSAALPLPAAGGRY
jgi:hypothetical protein